MTVVCAAIIPAAPILIPQLGGAQHSASEVLDAALTTLRGLLREQPDEIVVVAEDARAGEYDQTSRWALSRFGGVPDLLPEGAASQDGELRQASVLPHSLAIAAALLHQAGWRGRTRFQALDPDLPGAQAEAFGDQVQRGSTSTGLLLLGNGSACCTPQAPGAFREDAAACNAALLDMIRDCDEQAMQTLTAAACREQRSDIRVPLQVLAGAVQPASARTEIVYAEEFAGVFYLCALIRAVSGSTS